MSLPETRLVNGYVWPAADRDCAKVVFKSLSELGPALAHCKGFGLAVQAGGNCGVWPNHLALRFARVVTFEPDPVNFHCLRLNCTAPHIEAHELGLGEAPGTVGMICDPANVGAHFVEGEGSVGIVPLDGFDLPSCDLLCLDVEGYELPALKGARETIARFRPVIQVEEKGLCQRYGIRKGAVEAWLTESFGYRVVKRVGKDVVLAC